MSEGFRIAKIGQKHIFVIPLIYELAMQGVNGTFIKESYIIWPMKVVMKHQKDADLQKNRLFRAVSFTVYNSDV